MSNSIKLPLVLSTTLIVSGCSLDTYIQKIKDYLYMVSPTLSESNVCPGYHYFEANDLPAEIEKEMSGNITFFYWFGSEASRMADSSLDRMGDYFADAKIPLVRLPAINNHDWVDGAKWSLALAQMNLENNRDLISLSYEHFSGEATTEDFDKRLLSLGESSKLFHELKYSVEHAEEIMKLGDMTYLPGIEKIPAIVVDASYIVYPSDFNDMRDAWMTARYIFDDRKGLSSKCSK